MMKYLKMLKIASLWFIFSILTGRWIRSTSSAATLKSPKLKARAKRLLKLPYGLYDLTGLQPSSDNTQLTILVHGFQSKGYEWCAPIEELQSKNLPLVFFRYNYYQYADDIARQLSKELDKYLAAHPHINCLRFLGHSYGGIVASSYALQKSTPTLTIEVNTIASPLAAFNRLVEKSKLKDATHWPKVDSKISWHQWRTVKSEDGIYKYFGADPQEVEIPNSKITVLPKDFEDNRIGHNRSIAWVVQCLLSYDSNENKLENNGDELTHAEAAS